MMNSKRVFYVMVSGVVLLCLAIGGVTYFANTLLEKQAKSLSNLKLQNQVLNEQKTNLAKAKKDIAKYKLLEEISRTIVPQDKDQAATVRDIVNKAVASGFRPSSITLPASNLGDPKAASVGGASPDLTQLTPVKGTNGLYTLEITVAQDATTPIPYDRFIQFLSLLEQGRRTALVNSIALQPSAQDRTKLSFTLTLEKYIKP